MAPIPRSMHVVPDLLRAQREGAPGVARREKTRLTALVKHARSASGFYQRLYSGLPVDCADRDLLPPVTKPALMAAFDEWMTDPAVNRAGVEAFVADPGRIGTPYLGRYFVAKTSGTTGVPGLFVHDPGACRVYQALTYRIDLAWLSGRQWLEMLRRRTRWASVVGTGGHFAGEGWMEFQRRRHPWRRHAYRVFSLQQSLTAMVQALNTFQPAILTSYPSALEVLAAEQEAGRLRIRPVIVELAGESGSEDGRARIATALGGAIHDAYSASECLMMAFDCTEGWLHVNSDWVILEPVDADYSPTPPGVPSRTVLLTNLANRVQPLIRYDLGDSIIARPDPCPCGSPFPAIRVEGRRDDVLRLASTDGRTVNIPALAVAPVVAATPGVQLSQLVQSGPRSVQVRIQMETDSQPDQVWQTALANLGQYLVAQGITDVQLERAADAPRRSPTSGKFRHVIGMPGVADT